MRRVLIPLLVLLVVALGGYTGYWFYFAQRLRDEIGPWAEARHAQGYDLAWQSVSVGGFPFAFRLHFVDATLSGSRPVPYDLSGAEIIVSAAPWTLSSWRWSAPQGAQIETPGALAALHATSAEGTVTDLGATGALIAVQARSLSGQGTAQGFAMDSLETQLTLPARPAAGHLDTALSLFFGLSKLTLPIAVPSLGPQIDALSLTATMKGALPPGPLDRALAAWSEAGGTVELENARLVWGPVEATFNGTLALDSRLQPTGALTATVERPDAVVDAAVASGNLKERFAALAKTVLAVLEKPGSDGKPVITAPISVQDQQLFLGPAKIATLPVIVWD